MQAESVVKPHANRSSTPRTGSTHQYSQNWQLMLLNRSVAGLMLWNACTHSHDMSVEQV